MKRELIIYCTTNMNTSKSNTYCCNMNGVPRTYEEYFKMSSKFLGEMRDKLEEVLDMINDDEDGKYDEALFDTLDKLKDSMDVTFGGVPLFDDPREDYF